MLCVDDQAYFRGALRGLVAGSPGFIQVGEASSGEEAITAAADLRPDLVLMDVRMPGIDGCQTTARLLGGNWDPFIVLTSADPIEPPCALAARAGDVVFVSKGSCARIGCSIYGTNAGRAERVELSSPTGERIRRPRSPAPGAGGALAAVRIFAATLCGRRLTGMRRWAGGGAACARDPGCNASVLTDIASP